MIQAGKHPGKTNLTGCGYALNILKVMMKTPGCAIMKHNNPSGRGHQRTRLSKAYGQQPIWPTGSQRSAGRCCLQQAGGQGHRTNDLGELPRSDGCSRLRRRFRGNPFQAKNLPLVAVLDRTDLKITCRADLLRSSPSWTAGSLSAVSGERDPFAGRPDSG